jgi:hypothetical protein
MSRTNLEKETSPVMHTLIAYYLGRPASMWRAMLPQAGRKG